MWECEPKAPKSSWNLETFNVLFLSVNMRTSGSYIKKKKLSGKGNRIISCITNLSKRNGAPVSHILTVIGGRDQSQASFYNLLAPGLFPSVPRRSAEREITSSSFPLWMKPSETRCIHFIIITLSAAWLALFITPPESGFAQWTDRHPAWAQRTSLSSVCVLGNGCSWCPRLSSGGEEAVGVTCVAWVDSSSSSLGLRITVHNQLHHETSAPSSSS